MTQEEFATKIKEKYPVYKSVDTNTLVTKVLEKYPVYKSQISDLGQPASQSSMQPTTMQDAIAQGQTKLADTTKALGNYGKNVVQDYAQAGQNIQEGIKTSANQIATGENQIANASTVKEGVQGVGNVAQGVGRAALRTVGNIAGAAFAPITEAIKPIIEPSITKLAAKPEFQHLVNPVIEFANKHPEAAKDVQNLVDILTLGVGGAVEKPLASAVEKGIQTAGEATLKASNKLGQTGENIIKAGSESIDKATEGARNELKNITSKLDENATVKDIKDALEISNPVEARARFIDKLVTPDLSKGGSEAAIKTGRVGESSGIGNERDFTKAIPGFDRVKAAVDTVPGLDRKNTMLQNSNLIHDEIGKTAESLKSQLKDKGFFSPNEFNGYMNKIRAELAESPTIVGDSEKVADRILVKFNNLVKEKGYTPEGLLEARKELDNWISSQKPNAFDPATENAFTMALRAIRQGGNEFLIQRVPDVNVRELLQRQSSLYQAIENIAPKAAKEGSSWWKRFMSTKKGKALKAVGVTVGTAAGLGVGTKVVQALSD